MSMRKFGNQTREQTDRELADREAECLLHTTVDLEGLRPQVEDSEAYTRLIAEVQAATANNENLASLKTRISGLGEHGIALAKKVAGLVADLAKR